MVTIKEIAEELGVSTTTVSNVIHGKTRNLFLPSESFYPDCLVMEVLFASLTEQPTH